MTSPHPIPPSLFAQLCNRMRPNLAVGGEELWWERGAMDVWGPSTTSMSGALSRGHMHSPFKFIYVVSYILLEHGKSSEWKRNKYFLYQSPVEPSRTQHNTTEDFKKFQEGSHTTTKIKIRGSTVVDANHTLESWHQCCVWNQCETMCVFSFLSRFFCVASLSCVCV